MKYFFTLLFSLFIGLNLSAQLAPGSVAPNFALTDVDGQQHVLYDYLDQGKSVVLMVFAVSHQPSYILGAQLNDLNATYGPGGSDEAIFLALETDSGTNDALDNNGSVAALTPPNLPWNDFLEFPIINQTNSFATDFETESAYPYYMVVYPNRITNPVESIGDLTPEIQALLQQAGDNSTIPAGTNNVSAVSYLGAETICGSIAPAFSVQNLGLGNLNSFDAAVTFNGTEIGSSSWSGNLGTFETAVVGFPLVDVAGSGNLELVLSNPNGMTDDDLDGNVLTVGLVTAANIGTDPLVINFTADNFPEESSWVILNSNGTIVESSGSFMAGVNTNEEITFEESGCYSLVISDSGGDGLNQVLGANVTISAGDVTLFNSINYGEEAVVLFEVQLETFVPVIVAEPTVNPDGTVNFSVSSTENVVSWSWDFNDGTTATGPTATNTYTQNGTYSFTVTGTTDQNISETISSAVQIQNPPIADFTISQETGSNNTVQATDASLFTGDLDWDFDELYQGTINPASYTFTINGIYNICLMVENEFGSDMICKDVEITDGFMVGVENIETEQWSISPNPANETLSIESKNNVQRVSVFDTNGKEMLNITNTNTLIVSELPNGVYLVRIETAEGVGVKPFVKF